MVGRFLLLLGVMSVLGFHSRALADEFWRVKIVEPYIEMHTGPGRGYPVFHVVPRGETLVVLRRKTDWYKVQSGDGKQGWVTQNQLEQTVTEDDTGIKFEEVLLADYESRRFELGVTAGLFQEDPIVAFHTGFRFNDALLLNFSYSRIAGTFSSSSLYHLELLGQPFPEWSWQPNLAVGFGELDNEPQASLVNANQTQNTVFSAGLGVRKYITRSFLFRADYRNYWLLVEDDRNEEYHAITAGFSVFF